MTREDESETPSPKLVLSFYPKIKQAEPCVLSSDRLSLLPSKCR